MAVASRRDMTERLWEEVRGACRRDVLKRKSRAENIFLLMITVQKMIMTTIVKDLGTDKIKLEALLCGQEKVGTEMQETWYTSLTGATPYNKLKHLVAEFQRVMKINQRSKRW